MINIQKNIDLQTLNTFGLPGRARYFAELNDAAELPALCDSEIFAKYPVLWLGGGSNILLRGDYPGLVVKINNKGIREIRRSDGLVLLEAQAGEIWHDFVCHTVALGLNGLENLSLIPGTVGAAPVQNIGAYGVEVKDLIDTVKCFDLVERRFVEFSNTECRFAYRDSLFKQEGKSRYVICSVVFKLSTDFILKAAYGDLAAVLAEQCGGRQPTAGSVSEAVCTIRRSKLPDPKIQGNVGSFFKNPVVSAHRATELLAAHPTMPHYPQADGTVKLAAGWLIDQCGLKGRRIGNAAVHEKQALVIVNLGQASAADVASLADEIRTQVHQTFAVELETEPNWV